MITVPVCNDVTEEFVIINKIIVMATDTHLKTQEVNLKVAKHRRRKTVGSKIPNSEAILIKTSKTIFV